MKDRIKQLMESLNMTQQDFSKFLGQSTATMSAVFTGRTAPSMRLVEAIKKHIPNISYNWLLDGIGPMYADQGKQMAENETVAAGNSNDVNCVEKMEPVSSPNIKDVTRRGGSENVQQSVNMKISDNPHRKIVEIKVYYDDSYCDTFVLKDKKDK